jgi:hypothetical protein
MRTAAGTNQCIDCGYSGPEEECPECGELMGRDVLPIDQQKAAKGMPAEQKDRFFASAARIIECGRKFKNSDIASALNTAWNYYVSSDVTLTESECKRVMRMSRIFTGFKPLLESEKVTMSDKFFGKAVKADHCESDQPTEMKEHGQLQTKLKGRPVNTAEKTPIIPGTEKASGARAAKEAVGENRLKNINLNIMRENVAKLAKHIRKSLVEGAAGLKGSHKINFTALVLEGRKCNRTMRRKKLAESVADVEELLQLHPLDNVVLEAWYINENGISRKHEIQLPRIAARGPVVAEGKAIFRFNRNAELFAHYLTESNIPCKVRDHNWGKCVSARVTMEDANKAFIALVEYKFLNPMNLFRKKPPAAPPSAPKEPPAASDTDANSELENMDTTILRDTHSDIDKNPQNYRKLADNLYLRNVEESRKRRKKKQGKAW